jgi:PilZ domain
MDLRKSQRFPVHFRIFLMPVGAKEQTGTVVDLSSGGCRITTEGPVLTGIHVALRLDFPGEKDPVCIDRAAVRWSAGQEFGVYFVTMAMREHERLKALLKSLEKPEPPR